jgi:ABC-type amino acid transport substrate-binding protein
VRLHKWGVMNTKLTALLNLLIAEIFLFTGCTDVADTARQAASNDLLEKSLARGTLVIATDPAYPPQSELIEGHQ